MKIIGIDVYATGFRWWVARIGSRAARSSLDSTLVRITTDEGLVGWGETCPVGPTYQPHHAKGARAALMEMAPGLIGCDPTQILTLHRTMDSLLAGHRYAKAAVDIAAYDVTGKKLRLRVVDLLGGAATERVPTYYAVGIGDPDETAAIAADRWRRRGTHACRSRSGIVRSRSISRSYARSGNGWEPRCASPWTATVRSPPGDTLRLSRECPDVPFILEQPCNTVDEFAGFRRRPSSSTYCC